MKVRNQFLFVISIVLLGVFCWSVVSQLLFLKRAERGVGVVRELRARDGRCGTKRRRDCTKFLATVEFQSSGNRQSSYLNAGDARGHGQPLSKARHQVGDFVSIVFDPNRPEEIYRDRFWDLWGSSLTYLFLQVFTLAVSLRRREMDEPATLNLNESR